MYREMPGRYTGRVMAIGRGFGRYSTYWGDPFPRKFSNDQRFPRCSRLLVNFNI